MQRWTAMSDDSYNSGSDRCDYCESEQPDGLNEPFPLFVPGEDNSHNGELELCDGCHLAARILAYTREEPPFVDVGLYQEVTFYARQLATVQVGGDVSEAVNIPDNSTTDTERIEGDTT